ncbi:MAG TPA: glycosyltransferase family 4 protein [Vicinamibacterales bacterium]|jgi:glycosyltransferase involved in cell wall biosynthesis|nr:glycosyltransferase family 4 protein [Vicinamibacterales bacterium]
MTRPDRRVLICGPLFSHETVGGLPIALRDLAVSLRTRGWDVDLAITPETLGLGDDWRDARRLGPTVSGASRWLPRLRSLSPDVRTLLQHVVRNAGVGRAQSAVIAAIDRRLDDRQYDVVVAVISREAPGLAHFVTRRHPRSVLLSLNGLAVELRLAPWLRVARTIGQRGLHASMYRPVDPHTVRMAVFASDTWRDEAIRAGLPVHVARTIYFGLNTDGSLRAAAPTSGRLLWAGRLSREKGLHLFLDAIAVLRRTRHVTLTAICADGPRDYRAQIDQQIARLELNDAVRLLPAVPREDLRGFYASHDVLLFQSIFDEPVALVLMEAFAAGLAVVAPSVTARSALIRPDETCICFSSPSPADIARAITRALDDDALRQRVRTNARRVIDEQFSIEAMADAYDRALTELMASPGYGPQATGCDETP